MSYHAPYVPRTRRRVGRRTWSVSHVPPAVQRVMAPGSTYLGEDEHYYYWSEMGAGDGNLSGFGDMFKRMFKFTPKSFTPGNIYKGIVNTALTTATFGAYQLLPKNLKKSVYNIGKVAIPVIAGGVLAYTAGPAVMGMLMPKLQAAGGLLSKGFGAVGGMFGRGGGQPTQPYGSDSRDQGPFAPSGPGIFGEGGVADRAITIGGGLMNLLGKLPQNKQAEVVERLTPEDIAYMERHQQIPPHLRDYFDRMTEQTFNPPMVGTGAAALYPGMGEAPASAEPVQAGMMGGMNLNTILLFAVPLGFYLLTQKGGRR